MESIFAEMLEGKRPCVWLARDADHAAILEPAPASPGHAVTFPVRVTDAVFELDDAALAALAVFSKKIARALKAAVPCDKVALVAYGLKVRHAHLHLIPAQGAPAEIALDKDRPAADPRALEALAAKIRPHIAL